MPFSQGMMGPPADEYTKPYWVFGLPLWRYYRTTHIMRSEGLPQCETASSKRRSRFLRLRRRHFLLQANHYCLAKTGSGRMYKKENSETGRLLPQAHVGASQL
jgi:hypothetical protein